MSTQPTQRFSTRVAYYVRSRPRYPGAVIDLLVREAGLTPEQIVADVGSGTGFLAELFLRHGNAVYGIEPNAEMRQAGEDLLRGYPKFRSIDATAEATTLGAGNVDLVTAGQAFHWFDPDRSRAEFRRILRPGGWVALVWNERPVEESAFGRDYQGVVREFETDHTEVRRRSISASDGAALASFFGAPPRVATLPNPQRLDFAGLRDRVFSSSYMPLPDDPRTGPMLDRLRAIFDAHQRDGVVAIEYETRVYFGRLR